MTAYVENFKKYKPLLSELAVRDIKTRYRRSMLGVLWSQKSGPSVWITGGTEM